MAKRGYRRSYRWNRKKYFNYIARNYLKYTINCPGKLTWDNNGIKWSNGSGQWGMVDILDQAGNEYKSLRGYFASVKITGIAIECVPGAYSQPQITGDGTTGQAYLALQQVGEQATNVIVSHNPRCIYLSQTQIQRKYIPLTSGWTGSNTVSLASVNLAANCDGQPMNTQTWNVKVTVYMLFKTAL